MMIFELICENGHGFEGWFQDHASFIDQLEGNLIQCPTCGTVRATQRLSTGGVVRARQEAHPKGEGATPRDNHAFFRTVRELIETHFENVGPEFAKTALRMHYGVEEKKNIRGSTTEAEEQTLREEGVTFYKIPMPMSTDDSELN
jgi:hypothetical protein